MKIRIKMPRVLLMEILHDLRRPHSFASERIGFAFGKQALIGNNKIIILTHYFSIPDDQYIRDKLVGARIGSVAIRSALQECLNMSSAGFHVHMHDFDMTPQFSRTDVNGLKRLLPSFYSVAPHAFHGAILFGNGECRGAVWMPGEQRFQEVNSIRVVGYPIQEIGANYEYPKV